MYTLIRESPSCARDSLISLTDRSASAVGHARTATIPRRSRSLKHNAIVNPDLPQGVHQRQNQHEPIREDYIDRVRNRRVAAIENTPRCQQDRERERERVCVCIYVCVHVCMCVITRVRKFPIGFAINLSTQSALSTGQMFQERE